MSIIVDITRVAEDGSAAWYEFWRRPDAGSDATPARGRLRVDKQTGQIELVSEMVGDPRNDNYYRAMRKVREAFLRGEFPERLSFIA